MGLAEDLQKLKELRDNGTLSEEEFVRAKAKLLTTPSIAPSTPPLQTDAIGEAAKAWITYKVIAGIIGLIIAAIFFFGFFLPKWNEADHFKGSPFPQIAPPLRDSGGR